LDGSVFVAVHVAPQSVCPVGHAQTPAVHDWPAAQAVVQLPQ
jgi:hypothetical protein